MSRQPDRIVLPSADLLAEVVAARLALRILEIQSTGAAASIVLTGGTIAIRAYAALGRTPLRESVVWSRVNVWWGDERFLPTGHPDRNEVQAREALLDALPLDPRRVHPMPPSDGPDGADAEAAAARYAAELAAAGSGTPPAFDVLLLGIGEDGHIASVFPGVPLDCPDGPVSAVRNSPKPPPVRLTLTPATINTASEIWLVASGAGKAAAVRSASLDGGASGVPAAGVRAATRTVWLLDRAAAGPA